MPSFFTAEHACAVGRLLEQWVHRDEVPAVVVAAGDAERFDTWAYGKLRPTDDAPPVTDATIFLIASITKPIVALGVMSLVEQGVVKLSDAVVDYVPEFASHGKRNIRIVHLLTHTSGLPDMLPDNASLRREQAPIEAFLERTCAVRPAFLPGRDVRYQSMGFLMLGQIVRRATGHSLAHLLDQRIFKPLAMHDTALGMPDDWLAPPQLPESAPSPAQPPSARPAGNGDARVERIAEIRTLRREPLSATWNTTYWRRFGAPWGGLLSTAPDLARLAQHLLRVHRGHSGVVSPPTLEAMTRNALHVMPEVPEPHRRCFPWGYGWQLNWSAHVTSFGDLLSPAAYGHWGATGTLMWIDPPRDRFAVALTTQPLENGPRRLTNLSNLICAG